MLESMRKPLQILGEGVVAMLKRHWRAFFILAAVMVDVLAIGISGLVAYFLRENVFHLSPIAASRLFGLVIYSASFLIAFALVLGLYRASFHTNIIHQHALAAKAYFFAVPVILATFYFLKWFQLPRVFTTLFFITVPPMYALGRILLRKFAVKMRARGFGWERTLLIDQGTGGPFIFRRYDILPELGYQIAGVAFWNGTALPSRKDYITELAHCESGKDLEGLVNSRSIDQVLVTTLDVKSETMLDIAHACQHTGTKLKLLSQESEELLRFAYVTDIAGIPLYSPPHTKILYLRAVVKRAFDLLGSSILILLFSPILFLAALAIVLDSGRPVVFKQRRSSTKGGKEFFFYKFRSMVKNADELKDSLYEKNESDGALFKMKNDPRMTKVGRLIRRYSIDELPQLFNVLRGDMSLVGPRPLPVNDFQKHNGSAEFWLALRGRDTVKPGITGLWQICGRSHIGFREMILLDFYYIENQSLFFDLDILSATIPVVLFGKGAC